LSDSAYWSPYKTGGGIFFNHSKIFFRLFFRKITAPEKICKPRDGDDGGFEFMGKIVDKIAAEHFREETFDCLSYV